MPCRDWRVADRMVSINRQLACKVGKVGRKEATRDAHHSAAYLFIVATCDLQPAENAAYCCGFYRIYTSYSPKFRRRRNGDNFTWLPLLLPGAAKNYYFHLAARVGPRPQISQAGRQASSRLIGTALNDVRAHSRARASVCA